MSRKVEHLKHCRVVVNGNTFSWLGFNRLTAAVSKYSSLLCEEGLILNFKFTWKSLNTPNKFCLEGSSVYRAWSRTFAEVGSMVFRRLTFCRKREGYETGFLYALNSKWKHGYLSCPQWSPAPDRQRVTSFSLFFSWSDAEDSKIIVDVVGYESTGYFTVTVCFVHYWAYNWCVAQTSVFALGVVDSSDVPAAGRSRQRLRETLLER